VADLGNHRIYCHIGEEEAKTDLVGHCSDVLHDNSCVAVDLVSVR